MQRVACFIGLDYKKLVSGKHNPLDVIRPILTQDNINGIAKLAPKIPDQVKNYIAKCHLDCFGTWKYSMQKGI